MIKKSEQNIETNLVYYSALNNISCSEYLRINPNIFYIPGQYDSIHFLQSNNKLFETLIKKRIDKDIKSAVFFPVAGNSNKVYAFIQKKPKNFDKIDCRIKTEKGTFPLHDYISSVRKYILKTYGETNFVDDSHFYGIYDVVCDEDIEGNSFSLALWLLIFISNFTNKSMIKIVATGDLDLESLEVKPVKYILEKHCAIKRELIGYDFFYAAKEVYENINAFLVKSVEDVLQQKRISLDLSKFDYQLRDLMKIAQNHENTKGKFEKANEVYNAIKSNPNFALSDVDNFYIESYFGHRALKSGNIKQAGTHFKKAKKLFEKNLEEISSDKKVIFYSRIANYYIDILDLQELLKILNRMKEFKTHETKDRINNLEGNYYELKGDIHRALECYEKSTANTDTVGKQRVENYILRCLIKEKEFHKCKDFIRNPAKDNFKLYYTLKYIFFSKNYEIMEEIIESKPLDIISNSYIDFLSLILLEKLSFTYSFDKSFENHIVTKKKNILKQNTELTTFIFQFFNNAINNKLSDAINNLSTLPYHNKSVKDFVYNKLNTNPPSESIDMLNWFHWF